MKFLSVGLATLTTLLIFGENVSAETLYEYMFVSRRYSGSLSKSMQLAEKEKNRISSLVDEVNTPAIFLPVNSAWARKPRAIDALTREIEGNVRYDVLLAASADVNGQVDWEDLMSFAEQNGGVIDSAYGTPYFVLRGTSSNRGKICLAEWVNGSYQQGECSDVKLPPIRLDDASVFEISSLILPEDLENAIDNL